MQIGKAIEKVRLQKGVSKAEVVRLSGISRNIFYQSNPTIKSLQQTSDALEIPLLLLIFLAQEESDLTELGQDSINNLRRDLRKSLLKPKPLIIDI